MATKKPVTRSLSDHFLIGQEQETLGSDAMAGKLPTSRAVLQYLLHRKNISKFKYKPISPILCCPLKHGTTEANCESNEDCKVGTECVSETED